MLNLKAIDEIPHLKSVENLPSKLDITESKPVNILQTNSKAKQSYALAFCGYSLFVISVAIMIKSVWGADLT
jgi:hypothetical protein